MDPIKSFEDEVERNLSALAQDTELRAASRDWLIRSLPGRYSYNFTWLGRPVIQYPQDIVALQELVWKVQPDLIIETGIAHGGSLILSASLLALLDLCDGAHVDQIPGSTAPLRKVVGIDIEIRPHNRQAILKHPMSNRIEMIEGSSISPEVVSRVHAIAASHRRVMVLLDSNHPRDHVLQELRSYASLVAIGSYCVVYDTVVEDIPLTEPRDRPWGPGNSPMNSVDDYLAELAECPHLGIDSIPLRFEIDRNIDAKLMISVAPRGYLRRL
jgi:cephalosporin hydroxylase